MSQLTFRTSLRTLYKFDLLRMYEGIIEVSSKENFPMRFVLSPSLSFLIFINIFLNLISMKASSQFPFGSDNFMSDSTYRHRSNCYILLPKNYFNYIEKSILSLTSSLRNKIKDICDIRHDYTLPFYQDYVFKISTYSNASRAIAVKIISAFLFSQMEKTYKKMSYIKITLLIPDNVIRFVIGIEGRNINSIRSESKAKIDVFQSVNRAHYRQIELKGDPESICKASERIFDIEEKYNKYGKKRRRERSRSMSQQEKEESEKEEGEIDNRKGDIDVLLSEEEYNEMKALNVLKEIEGKYECSIREEKAMMNGHRKMIVTLRGTAENNSKGIYVLLHSMKEKK